MIGTFLNIATVLTGGTLGLLLGSRLPERMVKTVIAGLGLFTLAYGLYNFLKTQNPLIVLGSLLIGALLGEWWQVEAGLQKVGKWLESHFIGKPDDHPDHAPNATLLPSKNFVRGFLTASLVFCVGPMTILGSIQDGLKGDYSLLAISRSWMDSPHWPLRPHWGSECCFRCLSSCFSRGASACWRDS